MLNVYAKKERIENRTNKNVMKMKDTMSRNRNDRSNRKFEDYTKYKRQIILKNKKVMLL